VAARLIVSPGPDTRFPGTTATAKHNSCFSLGAASVQEPGCRQFDVLFEESNPHHVFLYEVYDNAAALEAHRATAHFKTYAETAAPMIARRVARHMSPIGFNAKAR
jgi:quinol monooxygenase YgiN